MKAFPGTTFVPAPGSEPRNKNEKRDMFVVWASISDLHCFEGSWNNPTKIVHSDHIEYNPNMAPCIINASAIGSLRVYKDHAEMQITDASRSANGRGYTGTIYYELNNEFYNNLNEIEWKASNFLRRDKIVEITAQTETHPGSYIGHLRCPDHRTDRSLCFYLHTLLTSHSQPQNKENHERQS